MSPTTRPAARLLPSRLHRQLTMPTSSDERDPFRVTTETGRWTVRSPPASATGAALVAAIRHQSRPGQVRPGRGESGYVTGAGQWPMTWWCFSRGSPVISRRVSSPDWIRSGSRLWLADYSQTSTPSQLIAAKHSTQHMQSTIVSRNPTVYPTKHSTTPSITADPATTQNQTFPE